MTNVARYTDLITSEHEDKPKFLATLVALVTGAADITNMISTMPALYDLDVAAGVQEDTVGLWVGKSRQLVEPLAGVYFSFDTVGLGFDEGTLMGPFDPVDGLVSLPDDAYRTLLRATIAANNWDGTIPMAYSAWDVLFGTSSFILIIQDNGNMSMTVGFLGDPPDAVTTRLIETGQLLSLRPAGVLIDAYVIPSIPDTPLFGFDVEDSAISGFDVGSIATILPAP